MDWLKFFRSEPKNTAALAKERLKVVVAHQRDGRSNAPAYLPKLREDIPVSYTHLTLPTICSV